MSIDVTIPLSFLSTGNQHTAENDKSGEYNFVAGCTLWPATCYIGVEKRGDIFSYDTLYGARLGIFNRYEKQDLVGVEVGLLNMTKGNISGVELGFINDVYGGVDGVQIGLLNTVGNEMRGAQIALFSNSANGMNGAQVALIANFVEGDMNGGQIALINVTEGAMVGGSFGLFNYYESLKGASIGVINSEAPYFILGVSKGESSRNENEEFVFGSSYWFLPQKAEQTESERLSCDPYYGSIKEALRNGHERIKIYIWNEFQRIPAQAYVDDVINDFGLEASYVDIQIIVSSDDVETDQVDDEGYAVTRYKIGLGNGN